MSRRVRVLVLTASTALSTIALTGVASAHVTVHADGATQGGYTKLTFRVPTEEKDDTVKLQVSFPMSAPIASVSTKPKAGWTVTRTMQHLATPLKDDDGNEISDVVGSITWTAAKGGGIPPEQFDEFEISAGPLPDAASMSFPALQTYADGTVVSWIEPAAAGGAEPDHPVPTLALAAASTTGGDSMANDGAASPAAAPSAAAVSVTAATGDYATKSEADTGRTLGIVGIVVGALGLVAGGLGLAAGRRGSANGTPVAAA